MAKRKKSRAKSRVHVVHVDHPIVALARAEPEVRKRRFIMALWHTIPHMNGDDLGQIEPVLQRIIGREFIEKLDFGAEP